jgi:Asp-tRNA(Asn)/Glu-tRNA(Gln) amidotransferase A subunit family amidase
MPVHKLRDLILKKKVSQFEVVSAFLTRIETVNPVLYAVVAFRPEEALKEPLVHLLHKCLLNSSGAAGETYKSLFEKTGAHLTKKNQKGFITESL